MVNKDNIRIVRGSDRYKGATDTDLFVQLPINATNRELVEGDRTSILNLAQRFDDERQLSTKFRLSGKITNIFDNTISGFTTYEPYKNNLYYVTPENAIMNQTSVWSGYPQYHEFSFYRTQGIDGHIAFKSKSAGTYNWGVYVSYPYENNTTQVMTYRDEIYDTVNTYSVSDGIPYVIKNRSVNGKTLTTFYCGIKHNLSEGEWVYLKTAVNDRKHFEVFSLGDENYGNEDKVFSIYNFGFTGSGFNNIAIGTFKRIVNIKNSGETLSQYYVRKHKILTNLSNLDLTKMGFENNPFPIKKKLEYSVLTPNETERISIKDGTQTVGISFDLDIDINGLIDNQDRPISELFITIVNKGYMGWFNHPTVKNNPTGIQIGWDMNFKKTTIDNWWDINNTNNRDNIPYGSYAFNSQTFYYNDDLSIGDTIKGDVCEWNDYDQTEVVLSKEYHKYSFNKDVFGVYNQFNDSIETNSIILPGYAYIPHHSIRIRDFSTYIEKGKKGRIENVPDYAYFSDNDTSWRWRDIYSYGLIDSDGIGVDYPFLNGRHYPYKNILFLQTPIKREINQYNSVVYPPTEDDCE